MSNNTATTRGVGSFVMEADREFRDNLVSTLENFNQKFQVNPIYKMTDIITTDVLFESYKSMLFDDVLDGTMESSFAYYDCEDSENYMSLHADKLDQLVSNTREELALEASSIGQLSPIVALTLPILKKEYLEMNFKEVLQTVVADKPVINIAYERKFLKDVAGNKYYIPDIFYDNSYKEITRKSIGKEISSKWYPETGNLPFQDLDMLVESGGSLERRDQLSYDFRVAAIKVDVEGESGPEEIIVPVDCKPDMANQAFNYTIEVSDTKAENPGKKKCSIYGSFDPYSGKVSIAGVNIKQVQFAGHLSNSNNTEIVELDRERKNIQYTISEKERFNTGITIERIRDEKALANIDTTVELVADMTEVCAQTKDSNIKEFLEDSFQRTLAAKDFHPMGYDIQFANSIEFDMQKAKDYMVPESEWRSPQLRMYFSRVIGSMKQQLRDTRVMFVVSGNPYVIERFFETDDKCRWVIDNNTKIGGVKFDYKFGVTTIDGTRIHLIATMKETIEKGLRIVAYPLTETVLTYRQYDYSFNIENNYRNPLTPNIPNIMAVQRYENIEYLPLQWEFYIKQFREGNLGFSPLV